MCKQSLLCRAGYDRLRQCRALRMQPNDACKRLLCQANAVGTRSTFFFFFDICKRKFAAAKCTCAAAHVHLKATKIRSCKCRIMAATASGNRVVSGLLQQHGYTYKVQYRHPAPVERRTRHRKVASSNPGRSDGRIFFSIVNFVC